MSPDSSPSSCLTPRLVVYTAVTGGYDTLSAPPALWSEAADFVAFVDDPSQAPGWLTRPVCRANADPCRNARLHKLLPHRFFPDYDCSVWVDGSVSIVSETPLSLLVERALGDCALAAFPHRARTCIFAEAAACIRAGKDAATVILAQVAKYIAAGYPPNNGLIETMVLIRRHTPALEEFSDAWHRELATHSRRDQLSFNFVAHQLNFRYALLPGMISLNEHFIWRPHVPWRATAQPAAAETGFEQAARAAAPAPD